MNSEIKVVRKGNLQNKLTIAKGRVEVKLRDDVTPGGEVWILEMAQKVVQDVRENVSMERTLRGTFKRMKDYQVIRISMSAGDYSKRETLKSYNSSVLGMSEPPKEL